MSSSINNRLWLRPYQEIVRTVPDDVCRALPGRIAVLSHPLNSGRKVLLPDREHYDPDVCVVCSSGVSGIEKGEVLILAPDHGAYFSGLAADGRECRMVGVVKPWWESVIARFTEEGIHSTPGWMLVEREVVRSPIEISIAYEQYGTVLSSCGDFWCDPLKGQRVCFVGQRQYTFQEGAPDSWCLVRAPIAGKKWLTSLRKEI